MLQRPSTTDSYNVLNQGLFYFKPISLLTQRFIEQSNYVHSVPCRVMWEIHIQESKVLALSHLQHKWEIKKCTRKSLPNSKKYSKSLYLQIFKLRTTKMNGHLVPKRNQKPVTSTLLRVKLQLASSPMADYP